MSIKTQTASGLLAQCALFLLLIHFLGGCTTGPATLLELEEPDSTILKAVNARSLTDVKYKSSPERIARGKYLMEGPLWCFNCHTERDSTKPGKPPIWEKRGSGALLWKTDSTHLYAPNITSDMKTGIGSFSDDMIARAIREGVGHDGRTLSQMPWWTFVGLSDEDVASVVTYLRTLPPIENKVPRRKLGKSEEERMRMDFHPDPKSPAAPDPSDPIARGMYLIRVADCIGCHTGWYQRNPGVFGGGNPMDNGKENVFSSNISSDSTGIGSWTSETFIYVMKNGKGKSGTIDRRMPWTSFRNMSESDLDAIYQALMTTYPVKHIVQNGVKPTLCEVCGLEHGLGDKNKIEHLKPYKENTKIPADVVGTYVAKIFPDTAKVTIEGSNLILNGKRKLMAINATEYYAEGFFAPVHFVRDSEGRVTGLSFNTLGEALTKVTD